MKSMEMSQCRQVPVVALIAIGLCCCGLAQAPDGCMTCSSVDETPGRPARL